MFKPPVSIHPTVFEVDVSSRDGITVLIDFNDFPNTRTTPNNHVGGIVRDYDNSPIGLPYPLAIKHIQVEVKSTPFELPDKANSVIEAKVGSIQSSERNKNTNKGLPILNQEVCQRTQHC